MGRLFQGIAFLLGGLRDELQNLPLTKQTKEIIRTAIPMGKTMRFIPVVLNIKSAGQLNDVYEIAQFRKIKVK
jgi:hypothetical protein